MTLTKQQKLDMIRDVELRIAKEELAEMHIRNMKAIEESDQPLRTLKNIINDQPLIAEKEQGTIYDNAKSPEPEILASTKQKTYQPTSEDKELLEQSKIATQTPFVKDGLDSKTQWTFTGLEKISVNKNTKAAEKPHLDFNLQEHFANAKSMFNDRDMGMER
ncbi:MAG: hypothetical protein ACRBB3_00010 [Alphaproteobacteria bacterium]